MNSSSLSINDKGNKIPKTHFKNDYLQCKTKKMDIVNKNKTWADSCFSYSVAFNISKGYCPSFSFRKCIFFNFFIFLQSEIFFLPVVSSTSIYIAPFIVPVKMPDTQNFLLIHGKWTKFSQFFFYSFGFGTEKFVWFVFSFRSQMFHPDF